MRTPFILKTRIQNHDANKNIISKARELRKSMTNAEKVFWEIVRNRKVKGYHFRKQHPFGGYILDFYCHKANLVVELDGKIHLKKKQYDREREEYLNSCGLRVLRFNNEDLIVRKNWVIERLISYLESGIKL